MAALNIDNIPVGPEMDFVIAETVMGWKRRKFAGQHPRCLWDTKGIFESIEAAGWTHYDLSGVVRRVPAWSTDITFAWKVIEKMRYIFSRWERFTKALQLEVSHGLTSGLLVSHQDVWRIVQPKHICRAAYKTVPKRGPNTLQELVDNLPF